MMSIKKYAQTLFLCLLIAAGTLGCDTCNNKDKDTTSLLALGIGVLASSPLTVRSTTYDMDNTIIGMSEQVIQNMLVQSSQPNMSSMYEMYAGVELEVDWDNIGSILTDPMSVVKQNPLLTQFWALQKMATSTGAGTDGTWMTSDDTIDPLLGYFETTKADDRYRQIIYSDFGVTPAGRIDYIVEDNKKIKTYKYAAGGDGDFGTSDDVLARTTVYRYSSDGRMERAVNYSDDEVTFESVYLFTYDTQGRLRSMLSYDGVDEYDVSDRMTWGSYSTLTWNDAGDTRTLDIELGLRVNIIATWDQSVISFHYEFNEDGTIHKMIQYEPMSTTIDTCSVYVYSEESLLGKGGMNDESLNYSDDGVTQVSRTVSELLLFE